MVGLVQEIRVPKKTCEKNVNLKKFFDDKMSDADVVVIAAMVSTASITFGIIALISLMF